ncbi:MAG: RecX family transcriptional regulator, partial [Pygmaiobacter sp.]
METMRISDIRKTKQGRFALFNEEGFLFSVDSETLVKYNVSIGTLLSEHEAQALKDASDARRAKDKALTYLSLRDYGTKELFDKLCRTFDRHTAAAAVAAMQQLELLHDEKFARHRALYLQGQKKSRREISQKLFSLGIDREIVDTVLKELPQEDATLEALITKSYRAKLLRGDEEKVAAALLRRGFSGRSVREAIARC